MKLVNNMLLGSHEDLYENKEFDTCAYITSFNKKDSNLSNFNFDELNT